MSQVEEVSEFIKLYVNVLVYIQSSLFKVTFPNLRSVIKLNYYTLTNFYIESYYLLNTGKIVVFKLIATSTS